MRQRDFRAARNPDLDSCAHQRGLLDNVAPPADWHNPTPSGAYHLLVIGAGPAGLVAARAAARLGAKVALIERNLLGGDCLITGCVPSKALIRSARLYYEMRNAELYGVKAPDEVGVDFGAAMQRVRRIRERISRTDSIARVVGDGVDLYFGSARFVGSDSVMVDGTRLRFKKAMIATGARPMLPDIEGLTDAGFLTNESVFELTKQPARLMVIGGGPLGCELAQAFARFGTRTIIAHNEPLFLPKEGRDAAQMVSSALAGDGVEIHLNSEPVRVRCEEGRKFVDLVSAGNPFSVEVDAILTGIGRTPCVEDLGLEAAGVAYDTEGGVRVDDFLRTSNPRIYAAGDVCLEHKFTDTAEASARIVVRNALFLGRQRISALTIPWCTYTDPEIAHVGLYVRQAHERGIPVKSFTVPMHEVDRAIADGEEDGFAKIHVREGTDRILGATVVARHAGEMINGVSLAMVSGIGLSTLAKVIHAYPTQAEALEMAANAYMRTRLTPSVARLARRWLRR
jgi:pyruvate/2-oxoglutarate dehydrogenase complex dihydrolipoamide dehydrogenase (E3) component